MTDSKKKPTPPPLGNFNWTEAIKQAEQEGSTKKPESPQGKAPVNTKSPSKPLSHKQNLMSPKTQMRQRRKV